MIQSEIEPATFRLVAQYLNQLLYRVPLLLLYNFKVFIHLKSQRYFYKTSMHSSPIPVPCSPISSVPVSLTY